MVNVFSGTASTETVVRMTSCVNPKSELKHQLLLKFYYYYTFLLYAFEMEKK